MKKYLQLLRVKNYVKNFLIPFPFVFSGKFLEFDHTYITMLIGFVAFCFMSSAVYILNDIIDVKKDRLHPKKSKRPIASGAVPIAMAVVIAILCVSISLIGMWILGNVAAAMFLCAYLVLNVAYSLFFKKYPVIDIAVLSLFFILRIYYGGILISVPVSVYLYLTIMSVAFMMGSNKRKKEKAHNDDCRDTLKLYSCEFLSKVSQMFMGLGIVFYTLWVLSDTNILLNKTILHISIFFVIVILIYYQYAVDNDEDGNPVDILLSNPVLMILSILYAGLMLLGFVII